MQNAANHSIIKGCHLFFNFHPIGYRKLGTAERIGEIRWCIELRLAAFALTTISCVAPPPNILDVPKRNENMTLSEVDFTLWS